MTWSIEFLEEAEKEEIKHDFGHLGYPFMTEVFFFYRKIKELAEKMQKKCL